MSEPVTEQKRVPQSTAAERWGIPISYAMALLYTYILTTEGMTSRILLAVFAAGFVACTEILYRNEKRNPESWFWLGCLTVVIGSELLSLNRVWEELSYLFAHLIALYYYMVRGNRLYEGETGRFVGMDGINAAFVFPFRNFPLRIRTAIDMVACRRQTKKVNPRTWIIVAAAVFAALLFIAAWKLLASADDTFLAVLGDLSIDWDMEKFWDFIFRFVLCIPVGAYLFGLMLGGKRQIPEVLHTRAGKVERAFGVLRKIPNLVWLLLVSAFIVLYTIFFGIQSSYIFGAFAGKLPEGFTLSQYARKGFFELCGIVALNFGLMGIIGLTGEHPVRQNKGLQIVFTLLLAESFLFGAVAMAKIMMYISCYGFTPLRLQSVWLVSAILTGCAASVYTLWTGKKSLRWWILFNAATLSVLHIV